MCKLFSPFTLLCIVLLFLTSCVHKRDNLYDPASPDYQELTITSAFSALPLSSTSIKVSWQDNNNREEGYFVLRGNHPDSLTIIQTLNANSTLFIDTTCCSYTKYFYNIGTFEKLHDTTVSDSIKEVKTLYDTPLQLALNEALTKPSGLSIIRQNKINDSIKINWNKNSGISGYTIERGLSKDSLVYLSFTTDTFFIDTIDAYATYYYAISAFDESSISNKSIDSISEFLQPTSISTYLVSNKDIRVKWEIDSKSTDSLIVERRLGNSLIWKDYQKLKHGSTNFLDTSITSFNTYYYRVSAFSGNVKSNPSNTDYLSVLTVRPPVVDLSTILCLNFNEDSGEVLFDSSSNKYNGKINSCSRAVGKYGNALNIPDSSFAFVPELSSPSDSSFMLEFWLKPSGYLTDGSKKIGIVESKNGPFIVYYFNGDIIVDVTSIESINKSLAVSYNFLPNRWTHIVVSFINGYLRLYIDDKERKMVYLESFKTKVITDTLFIGKAKVSGESYFFDGKIDEFRLKSTPDNFFK